jgi:hypothetical protein
MCRSTFLFIATLSLAWTGEQQRWRGKKEAAQAPLHKPRIHAKLVSQAELLCWAAAAPAAAADSYRGRRVRRASLGVLATATGAGPQLPGACAGQ